MPRLSSIAADTRPLRIPAFRTLWSATAITSVTGQFTVIGVPLQLYQLTGSSAYVGVSGLISFVAIVFAAPIAGAVADRVDRRTLMLVTSSGLACTATLLWAQAAAGTKSVPLLLALSGLESAFVGADLAVMGAVVPRLVPTALVASANSLATLVGNAGAIAGPSLAGVLIPVVGLSGLYASAALGACAVVWAIWTLPALVPPASAERVGPRQLWAGVRYITSRRVLVAVLVVDLIAMVCGMPVAVFPQLSQETFGDPPSGGPALGLLYAAFPFGVVTMGLLSGTFTRARRHGAIVGAAVVAWGLTLIGLGLARSLWLALVFFALGGAAEFLLSVFRKAITQTYTPDELRGRVQGALTVVTRGGPSLAVLTHGFAAEAFGTTWAISGGGVLVVLLTLATLAAAPELWRYTPSDAEAGQARA